MRKCLHCGSNKASYCEECYQILIAENMRQQQELRNNFIDSMGINKKIQKEYIPKSKIEDIYNSLINDIDYWKYDCMKDLYELIKGEGVENE